MDVPEENTAPSPGSAPRHGEALLLRGASLLAAEDAQGALEAADRALAAGDVQVRAEACRVLVRALLMLEHRNEAMTVCADRADLLRRAGQPGLAAVEERFALVLYGQGTPADIPRLDVSVGATQDPPARAMLLVTRADLRLRERDAVGAAEDAEGAVAALVGGDPADPGMRGLRNHAGMLLALALATGGRPEEALTAVGQVLARPDIAPHTQHAAEQLRQRIRTAPPA